MIKILAYIAFTIGIVFFILSISIGNSVIESFIFLIGIVVANVPEGLLP